jgi:membrane protein implicated in regulation of membrane protease activity
MMTPKTWLGIACLLAGVPLAAWSLADGRLALAFAGFALIFTFIFLVIEALAKAGKPKHEIRRAADAAWNLKDEPPGGGAGR